MIATALLAAGVAAPGAAKGDSGSLPPRASGSGGEGSGGGKLEGEVWANQAKMTAWVTKIVGQSYSRGGGRRGLGGVRIDPYGMTVTLAWKGPLPRVVRLLVSNPPEGISITVVPADHTRRELNRARKRLFRAARGPAAGWQLNQVGLGSTGSALEVGAHKVPAGAQVRRMVLSDLRDRYSRAAGVPVSLAERGQPRPSVAHTDIPWALLFTARWAMAENPWRGGVGTVVPLPSGKANTCSTGFSGTKLEGVNQLPVMLTAYHCAKDQWTNFWTAFPPVPSIRVGWVPYLSSQQDTELIRLDPSVYPDQPAGAAKVNTGPFDSGIDDYRSVAGATESFNGALVRSDGAMTGTHCGLEIVEDNTGYWGKNYPYWIFPMVRVMPNNPEGIVRGHGDSGGPVWAFSDGTAPIIPALAQFNWGLATE